MTAQALGRFADQWIGCARRAYAVGDKATFDKAAARSLELLTQVDQLMEAHPYHKLERWVDFARSHGSTETEKNAYEMDAKRQVTRWGACLHNYACKVWGGLVRDYYREMLRLEFEAMKKGTRFDAKAFMDDYCKKPGISPFTPCADPIADAKAWFKQAAEEKLPVPAKSLPANLAVNRVGEWTPAQLAAEWKTVEWPCPTENLTKITGVEFVPTGGKNDLEIQSVDLVLDSDVLASDKHPGVAGSPSKANSYKLPVPANASGNNACFIRAVIKGAGGTDSRGTIKLLLKK